MSDGHRSADAVVLALGTVDGVVAERLAGVATVIEIESGALVDYPGPLEKVVAIIARGQTSVDAALLGRLPGLRVIARSGVGIDQIDIAAATARGIPVAITPNAGARPVAEGTIALMLHLVKRIGPLTELVRSGRWSQRQTLLPGDVDGAALGIVGLGRIGTRVAELGRALGMQVLAFDPYADAQQVEPSGVMMAPDLGVLVSSSDVISLHAPLSDETRGMFGPEMLARMRTGAVLVNSSRGALVDLEAAYVALCEQRLGGLGLDVYEPEPPDASHPIFQLPNVVLTPHVLGLSARGWRNTFEEVADNLAAVLSGRPAPAVANPEIYLPRVPPSPATA